MAVQDSPPPPPASGRRGAAARRRRDEAPTRESSPTRSASTGGPQRLGRGQRARTRKRRGEAPQLLVCRQRNRSAVCSKGDRFHGHKRGFQYVAALL